MQSSWSSVKDGVTVLLVHVYMDVVHNQ
jgi:hypothetical protein